MNCETVRTLMSEYIDRMLDPEHAALFRAHLDECPACRRDLAAMEKTVALVRSIKPVAPPADLVQSVHARLEAGEKPWTSLRPMQVFQPVLAIAAGLVLVAGIGAYFLLEHGRRQAGFTVASVEHKQTFKEADLNANLSVKPEKTEAPRSVPVRESLAASAPLPVQAEQAGAIMDEAAAAKSAGRPRVVAGAVAGAGGGAARPSSTVQPSVNLTIATTNRAVVEQILLAFDVKRREIKEPQDMQLKELARKSNQAIVITLAASQLQDLLAQLKLQGKVSVADHDRETAQAPSKMKAGGSMSGAAVDGSESLRREPQGFAYSAEVKPSATKAGLAKEGDLLTVNVVITVP